MRPFRFTRPLRALSRCGVKWDNVALVPASLLPFKADWQRVANDMPHGDILIVLPYRAKQQQVACFVASRLREKGEHAKVIDRDFARRL